MTDRHDAPTEPLPTVPPAQRDTPRQPMAAASAPPRARAPISKPSPLIVLGGSFGLFFLVTALLGFQMRAGADPAIGAGEPGQVAAATPPPRKVLVRRVVVTRIVEHRRRDDGGSAPARSTASAPAPSAPAPAAPAPAPAAPAPAPAAPAPAPMTTQSS
jgi:hypothetical protein